MPCNGPGFLKSDLGYGKAVKVIFGVLSLPSFTPQIIPSLADRHGWQTQGAHRPPVGSSSSRPRAPPSTGRRYSPFDP
jgi:hypothetical protein